MEIYTRIFGAKIADSLRGIVRFFTIIMVIPEDSSINLQIYPASESLDAPHLVGFTLSQREGGNL